MSFSEWNKVKLKDITMKIGSGSTPRGGSQVYTDQGVTFVRSQNVYNNYFDYSGLVYINDEAAFKLRSVSLEENDILLNITGDSVARCTIVPTSVIPGRVNQHVSIIRVDSKKANYKFIKYVLVSPRMQQIMLSLAKSGGTRAALTKGMIENFEIFLPSLKEQKVIADILSSLDDKIELNNQMNETLEEMAQALFKRWFVDFEFPNEEGKPYKSSGGEMVESELGMIPKDWTSVKITEVANVFYGAAFKSKLFNEEGIGLPLIRIRDLKTFEPQFYTNEQHAKAKIVNPGSIVVGMDAEFTPTIWKGEVGYLNQRVCMFISNKNYIHDYFIFSVIKPHMKFLEFSKVGTTVIHLSKSDIDNIKIIFPDKILLEQYKNVMQPIFDEMVRMSMENKGLKKIRDALLPKLMSGEIRVSDLKS